MISELNSDSAGEIYLSDINKYNELLYSAVELNENSLVVDIGCYDATTLYTLHQRFGCWCIGIEPIPEFYHRGMERDFRDKKKVNLFNYGISTKENQLGIVFPSADGTKIVAVAKNSTSESDIVVDLKCAKEIFEKIKSPIDILIINIEGAEYELIPFMLSNDLLRNVKCIQIQFHPIAENSKETTDKIISDLKNIGYKQRFNFEFVWFVAVKD